jgi:hypothetical protein
MKLAIHQPEYFPWLGFVDKARRADVLVLLDHVQFDRSSLQHRAKVAGANGLAWLTIPFVHQFPQRIDEVAFTDDRWKLKHWKTLQACYGRAPGWPAAAPALEGYFGASYPRLVDAAVASVEIILSAFGAAPRLLRSSTLGVPGDKAALVLAICERLGATRYLSGRSGATYLDAAAFAAAGVTIEVPPFTVPIYPRARPLPDDVRGLSALDAWCQLGETAPTLLEKSCPASS